MTAVMPSRPTLLQQTRVRRTAQEIVAANVRAEFAVAHLRATDLARLLDVSYPTGLSRWHGRTPYRVPEIARIAAFLETPVDYLFTARTGPIEDTLVLSPARAGQQSRREAF